MYRYGDGVLLRHRRHPLDELLRTLVDPPFAAERDLGSSSRQLRVLRSGPRLAEVRRPPANEAGPLHFAPKSSDRVVGLTAVQIDLLHIPSLTSAAVAHYWHTLNQQGMRQMAGEADRGRRAAVTGGKQMQGFGDLVRTLLLANGISETEVFLESHLELPGYFRSTKTWDMLVVRRGHLIAAVEFKSQRGPSFGNNFNNRTEEAIGTATDLWKAYREGAFGKKPRPWLGWLMLLEDCPRSRAPVRVEEPHFKVFPEFQGASYADRYELLLRRLVRERLFDSAAFLMSTEESGPHGEYTEPAPDDLGIKPFLGALVAHAVGYQASAN